MGNLFLSFPNYADASALVTPVLSGGDWSASFPLSNLQDRLLSVVARSANATSAKTWFHADLGQLRPLRRVVVPKHNLSWTAQARVRATNRISWSGVSLSGSATSGDSSIPVSASGKTIYANDTFRIAGDTTIYRATATLSGSGSLAITPTLAASRSGGEALTCLCGEFNATEPLYDSSWVDVALASIPFGTLPWGSPGLWYGTPPPEDHADFPRPARFVTGLINARYIKVEFDDEGNADGYVELTRLFAAPGFASPRNFSYGAGLGWIDDTVIRQSLGGAEFYDEQPGRRVVNAVVENLTHDEAMACFFDMLRKLGRHGQLWMEMDEEDTVHMGRRSMLATFADLQPVEYTHHNLNKAILAFREVIA